MNSKEFKRGVEVAASFASEYDSSSTHAYRLEDCILAKFNLHPRKKPRANKRVLQHPDDAWMHGMSVALAEVHRKNGSSFVVCEVANEAGLTLAIAKKVCDPYDWKELKRAGVK